MRCSVCTDEPRSWITLKGVLTQVKFSKWMHKPGWIGVLIIATLIFPAQVWAHGPAEGGADHDTFNQLFSITLWMAIPVFVLVEGLLLFGIIRYRRRRRDEMPEQVEGNTRLEIGWTVLGFVIIAVLFVLTLEAFRTGYRAKANQKDTTPDLTVHVTGYMFNWDYEYFKGEGDKTGVKTTRELFVPANSNVLLEISSTDVQHSFWVPELAGKVDAVPGHVNTMWLKVKKPGTYIGQCAEYCGLSHYDMMIEVNAMEPADFDVWLTEQTAEAAAFHPMGTDMESEMPEGNADRGAQVFSDLACNACHADQDQSSGPGLDRMEDDAEHMKKYDYTDEQYLRELILMPCEHLAHGYEQCIMPQDYGERLDAQMLADLIEYLRNY